MSSAPPDSPPRRRLPPEQRRGLLLQTAKELFTTRPVSEVSMADVAREAGVSKALAFRYFSSKQELFVEAVTEVIDEIETATQPDLALPVAERLRDGLRALFDITARYPNAMNTFRVGDIDRNPEVRVLVDAADERAVDRIVGGLEVPVTPRLQHAVRSWLWFVRACNLQWHERPEVSRDTVIELEIATFRTAVGEALAGTGTAPPAL